MNGNIRAAFYLRNTEYLYGVLMTLLMLRSPLAAGEVGVPE